MREPRKSDMEKIRVLRGMIDLLPNEIVVWQHIESIARDHFQRASISEIRTPLLEATELFCRGIGENTDVVGKEMYSFLDKGQRNCTLRPEGTASVVRAAIQHGLLSQGGQKLWYSGPMFRYERPQAGRQRQFHQIGIECLGFSNASSDIEAVALAWDLLNKIGVRDLSLEMNSLGDTDDRKIYRQKLIEWLDKNRAKLDPDSQERINKNPLRILDSKNPSTQELLQEAPNLSDSLSPRSQKRFEKVLEGLDDLQIPYKVNPFLVRGLDYYSHTAFEITSTKLGAQATICGGGRYDSLVEQLGGPATPSIGWAIGMERLVLLLCQDNQINQERKPQIYIVNRGLKAELFALKVTRNLRMESLIVETDLSGGGFSKQLKRADKSGARWAILIGDDEVEAGEVIIKDLRTTNKEVSKEERISLEALSKRFL